MTDGRPLWVLARRRMALLMAQPDSEDSTALCLAIRVALIEYSRYQSSHDAGPDWQKLQTRLHSLQ